MSTILIPCNLFIILSGELLSLEHYALLLDIFLVNQIFLIPGDLVLQLSLYFISLLDTLLYLLLSHAGLQAEVPLLAQDELKLLRLSPEELRLGFLQTPLVRPGVVN